MREKPKCRKKLHVIPLYISFENIQLNMDLFKNVCAITPPVLSL